MSTNRTLDGRYGEAGVHAVTTGNTAVGDFCAVTSLHDNTSLTVVSADTTKDQQGRTLSGASAISSVVIPKGVTVYGSFSSVAITGTDAVALVYNTA